MSHKKVESVCFVIDASIARAAGTHESKNPPGSVCRDFLMKIKGICHRIAWNAAIKAEWEKHHSAFAKTWLVAMVRLRKVRPVPDEQLEQFREAINQHSTDAGVVAALLKDAHLVEAALAADCRVAALDDTVQGHLSRLKAIYPDLQRILWVNPVTETQDCTDWIEAGAPESDKWCLRVPDPG
jgi:hypothetical protein